MSESTSEHHGYDDVEGEDEAASAARFKDLEEARTAFQHTFGDHNGERVLAFLRDFCHQSRPSYVPGDSLETVYNEGRRSVMLLIMRYVNLSDEEILRLAMTQAQRKLR